MLYAFTGSRTLNEQQISQIDRVQREWPVEEVYVGDADGVDEAICDFFYYSKIRIFHVQGQEKKDFALRSIRMIDALAEAGGELIAFADRPCPRTTSPSKPFSGGGSGTWATVAYAVAKGINVTLFLSGTGATDALPLWFPVTAYTYGVLAPRQIQLSLF